MESMAGGIQNVGCIPRDLRNYERDLRAGVKGHDETMFIEYFQSEQEKNPSFYFSYEKDDEGRLTRCFWADTTSQIAYHFFNDVLVFDSTYNTNKCKMIFAPFAGVNHHGQTIVFGFGLLSNEKTESYIWLFEQWLKAMPSGPPKVIITDQDQAIANAITQAFPLAFHRYCIWHIMFKFREKLGLVHGKDYLQLFRASVYNSETVEEFEASWKSVVQQGKLEDHPWLNTMYGLRHKWVLAFCDHIFQAGMQSSQRAESNLAFFKTFVSHENTLLDFATWIDRGIRSQRHKELESDHLDLNEVPKTKTYYPVEKQMREVYTKFIFLSFQDQVIKSTAYLRCDTLREDEKECVYTVIRAAADEQNWKRRQILYDKTSGFAKCSCRFFEHEGIACRHIIFFFRSVNIVHLPSAYNMDRWTKSAKDGRVWDGDGVELKDDVDKSLIMRHVQLSQISQDIIDMESLSSETTEYCREEFCVLRIGIKECLTSLGVEEGVDEILSTRKRQPQQILIKEPSLVNAKGGSKRMKSAKELAMASQRKCSTCNQVGHNKATCQNAGVQNAVVEPLVVEDENFQNAGVQDAGVQNAVVEPVVVQDENVHNAVQVADV